MIHTMLPSQDARRKGARREEPYRRLMAAVMQTVIDDCRGSVYRRARRYKRPIAPESAQRALGYVTSTDRSWPFSFENLCDALGLDAGSLRSQLRRHPETVEPRVAAR